MLGKVAALLALVLVSQAALAETTCDSLNSAVDAQLKKVASSYADGITDNSAPRATMRELQISNSLTLVRINLELMAQNKCPAHKAPIDPMIYLSEALDCEIAIQKGEKDPAACQRSDWKGLKATPAPATAGES